MKTSLFLISAVAVELASGQHYDRYIGLSSTHDEDTLYQPRRLRAQRGLMSMPDDGTAVHTTTASGKGSSTKSNSVKVEKTDSAKAEKADGAKAEKDT